MESLSTNVDFTFEVNMINNVYNFNHVVNFYKTFTSIQQLQQLLHQKKSQQLATGKLRNEFVVLKEQLQWTNTMKNILTVTMMKLAEWTTQLDNTMLIKKNLLSTVTRVTDQINYQNKAVTNNLKSLTELFLKLNSYNNTLQQLQLGKTFLNKTNDAAQIYRVGNRKMCGQLFRIRDIPNLKCTNNETILLLLDKNKAIKLKNRNEMLDLMGALQELQQYIK